MAEQYNSISNDILPHKANFVKMMSDVIQDLVYRDAEHDNTKFVSPELDMYNEYIPQLQKVAYGTPEYVELRDRMVQSEGQRHHFEASRHHPEHFENGVADMNLLDLLEMLCDWKAASLRSDTPFIEGIKFNKGRFNISDQLMGILANTVEYLGW